MEINEQVSCDYPGQIQVSYFSSSVF